MSNSRHPIALRLERRVDGSTRLLATVMALPLVDGIFAALVLAGLLETVGGLLQVGLLVFGGSATVAVILAEMGEGPREHLPAIGLIGVGIVVLAMIEAMIAPTIASVLDLAIFERFAAIVLLAVAAQTASARLGEYLPRPAVIIALGLVASFDPAGASVIVSVDPELILRAGAAAGIGALYALGIAVSEPILRRAIDLDRFRFGSAVALGTLPLSILGLAPGNTALVVLAVAAVLAFDPEGLRGTHADDSASALEATDRDPDPDRSGSSDANRSRGSDDPVTDRYPWL